MAFQPDTEQKKRVLVVDDEPDITFTLKKGLENSGFFEVDVSNDPLEVLSNFNTVMKYSLFQLPFLPISVVH